MIFGTDSCGLVLNSDLKTTKQWYKTLLVQIAIQKDEIPLSSLGQTPSTPLRCLLSVFFSAIIKFFVSRTSSLVH